MYRGIVTLPRNKSLKDVTVREIAAMTPKQAKEMLAYLAGYGIDKDAQDFRRVWNLAMKVCCAEPVSASGSPYASSEVAHGYEVG